MLVAVRDTGPGLDPQNLDRLFEAFYTTKPTGMGMGLAICRSIIEAHEGKLWASANESRGAVFQFTPAFRTRRDRFRRARRPDAGGVRLQVREQARACSRRRADVACAATLGGFARNTAIGYSRTPSCLRWGPLSGACPMCVRELHGDPAQIVSRCRRETHNSRSFSWSTMTRRPGRRSRGSFIRYSCGSRPLHPPSSSCRASDRMFQAASCST